MRHYQLHYCEFNPHNEHDICVRQKYILTIVTLQRKSTSVTIQQCTSLKCIYKQVQDVINIV
jgi:hypothetical protein